MSSTIRFILLSFFLLIPVFTLNAQEPIKVKAKSGDGIHLILRNHQMNTKENYLEFIKLNQDKLINKDQLIVGETYILPYNKEVKKGRFYEIFGEKYGYVDIVDNQLKGAIYYLVSGHGGVDPGAIGKRNGHFLTEDEYAYDICLRLARELISHGALVYVIVRDEKEGIRDDDYLVNNKTETVWKGKEIPLNVNKKLRQRAQVVNQFYDKNRGAYQRLIVMHIDSRSKSERVDVFGYYNSKSNSGKLFTEQLISALRKNYNKYQPNRAFEGITKSRNGLYMLKYTHPVTAFLELGNIQNPKDQIRFIKSSNRQAIADWLTEGCINDYNK